MKYLGFILCIAFTCTAYGYAGISIDPLRVEFTAKPGEKHEGVYTITNTDEQPLKIAVESNEYFTLEENKQIKIDDFLTLSQHTFNLAGNGSHKITYSLVVPEDAQGFLMVMNRFSLHKLDDDGQVKKEMLNTAYSVPIYVRIDGRQHVSAEIDQIRITGDLKSLKARVTIRNTGNTYLRPSGTVSILKKKKIIGSISLKKGWPVFPDQSRSYEGEKKGFQLKPGTYRAVARLTCDDIEFSIDGDMSFTIDKKGIVKKK